jgi:hypothetical protein
VWRGDYVFVGLVVGVPEVEVEFGTVGYGCGTPGLGWTGRLSVELPFALNRSGM